MNRSGEILRGNTETIILAILKNKDSYGYEIMKKIIEGSRGLLNIKDATVYTAFKRMEKKGLIASYWGDEENSPRRKYYKITAMGKEKYVLKVKEWQTVKIILDDLIGGNL